MRRGHSTRGRARRPHRGHAPLRLAVRDRDAALPLARRIAYGGHQRNGMILKLKRTPGIYIVGFMGAGKSTVGRHLAHRLGWSFFDTDAEIEAAEGTSIQEIF